MKINHHIVVATLGLVTIGIVKKATQPNAQFTPVLVGGFVFMLALSVMDLFGGDMSKLASALAMVALVSGGLSELGAIQKLANVGTAAKPGTQPAPPGH